MILWTSPNRPTAVLKRYQVEQILDFLKKEEIL